MMISEMYVIVNAMLIIFTKMLEINEICNDSNDCERQFFIGSSKKAKSKHFHLCCSEIKPIAPSSLMKSTRKTERMRNVGD